MNVTLQILVSVIVFAGVFLPIYALFRYPIPAEPPVHRRFAAALGADRATIFENPLLAPVMNLGLALTQRLNLPAVRARIRQQLDASGNPSGYSVREYLAICIVSAAALGIVSALLVVASGSAMALIVGPAMAVFGFMIPLYALTDAGNRRGRKIGKQLPYTLDLVALTMAAGSTFTEAVQTLIRDEPEDDLNQELAIVLSEVELGTPAPRPWRTWPTASRWNRSAPSSGPSTRPNRWARRCPPSSNFSPTCSACTGASRPRNSPPRPACASSCRRS